MHGFASIFNSPSSYSSLINPWNEQKCPLNAGDGLLHFCFRVFFPPPQVTEQGVYSSQLLQLPWTVICHEKYNLMLLINDKYQISATISWKSITITWTIFGRTRLFGEIFFAIYNKWVTRFSSILFWYSFLTFSQSFHNFILGSIPTVFENARRPISPHTINCIRIQYTSINIQLHAYNQRSWNIICCRNQLLPGQFCSLQVSSCLELPSHFPLYFSVTVLLLNFVFLPPPQLLEHEPISQLPHSQFTKYQQEIHYIIHSSYTVSNEIV